MTDQLTEEYAGTELAAEPGPPAPIRIPWAPVPKVNLLPIEIVEKRRFRRTQVLLGLAVLGVVLLAGVGTYLAQRGVTTANEELVAAQARVSAAQAEAARYASVPKLIAEVEAAGEARARAMSTDVLWYRYLNDLDGARPAGVKLSAFSLTVNSGQTTTADPLSEAGVGLVAMSGTSGTYGQVASWLEALNKISGVGSSSLANAAVNDDEVNFSSGAVINSDALSGRYQKKAG